MGSDVAADVGTGQVVGMRRRQDGWSVVAVHPAHANGITLAHSLAALCHASPMHPPANGAHLWHDFPLCRRCIARMDHHCIWINSCVGLLNMRWFLAFLLSTAAVCFYGEPRRGAWPGRSAAELCGRSRMQRG